MCELEKNVKLKHVFHFTVFKITQMWWLSESWLIWALLQYVQTERAPAASQNSADITSQSMPITAPPDGQDESVSVLGMAPLLTLNSRYGT